MVISKNVCNALLGALMVLPAAQAFGADQWHFVVKNKTDSNITKLEVSIDKKSWGNFDIGSGIGPGATETLVWDASTNDEPCEQWIRAKFKDGSTSEPSKQDFCQDLDDPIEFSE